MTRIKRTFVISSLTLIVSYLLLMLQEDMLMRTGLILTAVLFLVFLIKRTAFSKVLLIITAFIAVSLISFSFTEAVTEKENTLTGYGKEIHGTVTDITLDEYGGIHSVILSDCSIDNNKILSKITLYPNGKSVFAPGDRLLFTATEVFISESEGIFRYHSLSDRCRLSCYNNNGQYTVTDTKGSLYISILKLKNFSSGKLKAALTGDSFSVANALFTGSKDTLSPELSQAFRICGISHIFAVSGMHLSLWTGLFFIILKRKAKTSFIPNILAGLFVVFYTVFTGFSPSVLRSGIMLLTVFAGRMIKRKSDPLNTLGLSGTILLTLNPYLAGNVSFLLSFTATGAIALWDEFLLPGKKNFTGAFRIIKARLIKPLYDITISIAVILTTLPLVSLFFGYFSLISPFASLIITPVSGWIMISSAFLVVLPENCIIHTAFRFITEFLCQKVTDTVFTLCEADFMLIPADFNLLLPCFAAAVTSGTVFTVFLKDKRKALISILSCTLIFALLTATNIYLHKDEAEIVVFGGENATLIAVSDNSSNSAIIGSGGSFSLLSELSRYLSSRAIVKTDLLFIPRDSNTENKNTEHLQQVFTPRNTVLAYNYTSPVKADLWGNNRIYSITEEDFSALSLYINSTKIVICTLPSSDFTENSKEFSTGDVLVCRSNIPESLDISGFSDIIIMTDCNRRYPFPFISTQEENIEITVKGDSYAIC